VDPPIWSISIQTYIIKAVFMWVKTYRQTSFKDNIQIMFTLLINATIQQLSVNDQLYIKAMLLKEKKQAHTPSECI
jgi:hypothetical protein